RRLQEHGAAQGRGGFRRQGRGGRAHAQGAPDAEAGGDRGRRRAAHDDRGQSLARDELGARVGAASACGGAPGARGAGAAGAGGGPGELRPRGPQAGGLRSTGPRGSRGAAPWTAPRDGWAQGGPEESGSARGDREGFLLAILAVVL